MALPKHAIAYYTEQYHNVALYAQEYFIKKLFVEKKGWREK